ncbi:MAG: crossover junction endodeoxyribonuclease RuvC [Polyangia bacterium]
MAPLGTKKTIRILGVDPGTVACGYGVVDVPGERAAMKPRYVECGVIELDAKSPLSSRLVTLAAELREVIDELRPDELSLEAAFHGVNARSALLLGHARGVIMLLGAEASLPIGEYPPATVKRAVAGHGRAQKTEVQRVVSWLFGLRTAPRTDAADALAIALCHAYHRASPTLRVARSASQPRRSVASQRA